MVLPTNFAQRRRAGAKKKCPRIDFTKLKDICERPINDFHVFKGVGTFVKVPTPDGAYFYKDNGAKILMVAHLDSVNDFHWAGILNFKHQTEIYCSTLDDRLGVYVTLDMLKRAGLEYDILLTTNEEMGSSSAQWFEPPKGKEYNWIAEFDRSGTDVVTYNYHSTKWRLALDHAGFDIGNGTYSDISDLDHLGVCGVNIGVGYHSHHNFDSYAILHEIQSQVEKFIGFYEKYKSQEFEYAPLYNILTDKGLAYSPHVAGRFNRDEYDMALDLYEQMQAGQSFEALGYRGMWRLTPENINLPKKKQAQIFKHPTYKEPTKKVDEVESKQIGSGQGSEDDNSSKHRFVVYPKPVETTAKEVAAFIESRGFDATVTEKCIECGKYYVPPAANTTVFCAPCEVIVRNRHSKDDSGQKEFSDKWVKYKENKKLEKASRVAIPEDKEALSKIADKQIGGALAQLNDIENPVDAHEVGIILRMVREEIPHDLAKPIFDDLVKNEHLRAFRIGKGVPAKYQNWPTNPKGRAVVTHAAIVALMNRDNLSIELEMSNTTGYKKWLSKMESGHEGMWNSTKTEMPMFNAYLTLLGSIVEDKWLDVVNRVADLPLEKIMADFRTKKQPTPLPEKSPQEGPSGLVTLGMKFKLDNSNMDYDLKVLRKGTLEIPTWERIKIAATA